MLHKIKIFLSLCQKQTILEKILIRFKEKRVRVLQLIKTLKQVNQRIPEKNWKKNQK